MLKRIREWLLLLVMEATLPQFKAIMAQQQDMVRFAENLSELGREKQNWFISSQLVDLMQDIRKCVEEGLTADLKQHITDTLDQHYGAIKDAAANHAHETLNKLKTTIRMRCDVCTKESWHFHIQDGIDPTLPRIECNDCRIKRLG